MLTLCHVCHLLVHVIQYKLHLSWIRATSKPSILQIILVHAPYKGFKDQLPLPFGTSPVHDFS